MSVYEKLKEDLKNNLGKSVWYKDRLVVIDRIITISDSLYIKGEHNELYVIHLSNISQLDIDT